MKKNKAKQIIKDVFQGLLVVLVTILVALSLRIFIFASFKIPSPSMVPAIESGDYILVNKLIPGPRVYKNFHFLKGEKIETKRFKGVRAIRRNDVLVFNFPHAGNWDKIEMDLNTNYVKRCIAIPGDTFYIDNGIYKVKSLSDTLGYYPHQQQLSKMKDSEFRPEIWNCYPYDTVHYNWNVKHFGPLYIPGKGNRLQIDTVNCLIYGKLIEYETAKSVTIKGSHIYLDGNELNEYTFEQNYYFMSGDLVFDSRDSRYWGLLPEDHIIGKVAFIWQSKHPETGRYNWKRFFKTIN